MSFFNYSNRFLLNPECFQKLNVCASTPRNEAVEQIKKVDCLCVKGAAKQAASTATQFISAAQGAAQHNSNKVSQEELHSDCKSLAEHIPALVQGVKGTLAQPDSATAQLNLISASHQFVQVLSLTLLVFHHYK